MSTSAEYLVEADRHIANAHRMIRWQKRIISESMGNHKNAHATSALLSLMTLLLPIAEDQRQQLLILLAHPSAARTCDGPSLEAKSRSIALS